jgi:hypothetical protein
MFSMGILCKDLHSVKTHPQRSVGPIVPIEAGREMFILTSHCLLSCTHPTVVS